MCSREIIVTSELFSGGNSTGGRSVSTSLGDVSCGFVETGVTGSFMDTAILSVFASFEGP